MRQHWYIIRRCNLLCTIIIILPAWFIITCHNRLDLCHLYQWADNSIVSIIIDDSHKGVYTIWCYIKPRTTGLNYDRMQPKVSKFVQPKFTSMSPCSSMSMSPFQCLLFTFHASLLSVFFQYLKNVATHMNKCELKLIHSLQHFTSCAGHVIGCQM